MIRYSSLLFFVAALVLSAPKSLNSIHADEPSALTTESDQLQITPNAFTGTDVDRINSAIRFAADYGLRVVIPKRNAARAPGDNIWLIDSAILVQDGTVLELNRCHIKLSDRCRDNMIRSANCGLGIEKIKPISHVSIYGVGDVLLEGADRPRATGDSAKTLGRHSFGTDAGIEVESQTGDWRNIGILLAYVKHFRIENLTVKDSHCWAISLERCEFGRIENIHFSSDGFKMINGKRETILNQDGIDLRQGCHDISIERIRGATGDDLVALTCIVKSGSTAGSESSTMVTAADCRADGVDDIRNIFLRDIAGHSRGGHHVVRFLNASGLRIYNVVLDGLIDTSPAGRPCKATLKIGDSNPRWGGVTPLGDTNRLMLSNISGASTHTILIAGSLTDSCISNVIRKAESGQPITYASGRQNVKNVAISGLIQTGNPAVKTADR